MPDISLLQPLAQALGISVIELMNGEHIINNNVSANMLRSRFTVCPLCGNAQTRLQLRGRGFLYYYCNQHGLFRVKR